MIEKFGPHYSMQNNPTVYDEEALTALEAIGRLGHKMNEVITHVNGMNVPEIVNVAPTGDKTGELDRVVIQGKLDKGFSVHLSAGEYYLNGPLLFRAGYTLRGESQKNTIINCSAGFIDHDPAVSVDHIAVRDLTARGPGSGVGLNISRKVSGIETGARYANFSNVSIAEYDTCVLLGGCWCTNFTHCRFDCLKICVEQLGSCNNVKYDHCMMLGPADAKTSTAVKITATNGAENYGINFDHCDFERHKYAIHAYYCVALTVNSIYAEGIDTVFHLDGCPAFLCDGGYVSYAERVCNTSNSNTAGVFTKCTGAIRNIYARVNSAERWYFASSAPNFPLNIEGIDCVNDGVGECVVNAQQINGLYNGHEYATTTTCFQVIDPAKTPASTIVGNITEVKTPKNAQVKLQGIQLCFDRPFTATKNVTIELKFYDPSGYKPVFRGYVNNGQSYQPHEYITFAYVGEDYKRLIYNDAVALRVASSLTATSWDFGCDQPLLKYTLISDKIIL